MHPKHKQSGFSLLAVLAVVLALAAVGFASYYVWHKNHTTKQNTTKQEPASTSPKTPAKTEDKLVIKEWGIQITIPPQLRGDVTYKIDNSATEKTGGPQKLVFRSVYIAKNSPCKNSNDISAIDRESLRDGIYTIEPAPFKEARGFRYYFSGANCAESIRREGSGQQKTIVESMDQAIITTLESAPEAYKGWHSYSDTAYGLSFKYPSDWKLEKFSGYTPSESIPMQEAAINLSRVEEYKYNSTVFINILNASIEKVLNYYDSSMPEQESTQTTHDLKGKKSVQYILPGKNGVHRYLFAVGTKTYVFESVDTVFNQSDLSYWQKFDLLIESLELK